MSGKVILKSGLWYTVTNVMCKGIGFFTVPIIVRILGKTDYGLYSNYTNWLGTLSIIISISLSASLISAKYDYEDKFDKYISSMVILELISSIFWTVVILIFKNQISSFTKVDDVFLGIMCINIFFIAVVDIFQHRAIFLFAYKESAITSVLLSVSIAILLIILSLSFNNSLLGTIMGYCIPYIIIGIFLLVYLVYKGKGIMIDAWKYALKVCIPYIPHLLSLTLLNSLDKMMITRIRGSEENALYSVAYNCGIIITIIGSSVNSAFSPWLGERLHNQKLDEIKRVSKYYVGGFALFTILVMLIGPELIFIMGGKEYSEAVFAIIPVMLGCLMQFIYTLYVDVEQYEKKTKGMAVASVIAAVSNYILNAVFIPRYGYIAAAYTTFISYVVLLILHILLVWKIGFIKIYSQWFIFLSIVLSIFLSAGIIILYKFNGLRIIIITLIAVSLLFLLIKKRSIVRRYVYELIR